MSEPHEQVGKYFMDDQGALYKCIAYIDRPAFEYEHVETKKRVVGVIGSLVGDQFRELILKGQSN